MRKEKIRDFVVFRRLVAIFTIVITMLIGGVTVFSSVGDEIFSDSTKKTNATLNSYPNITLANYEMYDNLSIRTTDDYRMWIYLMSNGHKFENKTIYLLNDLDFKGVTDPFLDEDFNLTTNTNFYGTFDGLNHVIKNIGKTSSGANGYWITPFLGHYNYGTMKNLTIDSSCYFYSGVCGRGAQMALGSTFGLLQNVNVYGTLRLVSQNGQWAGGTGVCGSVNAGGVVDSCIYGGNIYTVLPDLTTESTYSWVTGIVYGFNGTVINCLNVGLLQGGAITFLGRDNTQKSAFLINSFAFPKNISGEGWMAGGSYYSIGITYYNTYSTVHCYYNNQLSGSSCMYYPRQTDASGSNGTASFYGKTNAQIVSILNSNVNSRPYYNGYKLKKLQVDSSGNFSFINDTAPEITDITWDGTISLNGKVELTVVARALTGSLATNAFSIDGVNYQSSNILTVTKVGEYTVYVKDSAGTVTSKGVYVTRESIYNDDDFIPNCDTSGQITSYTLKLKDSHKATLGSKFVVPETHKGKKVTSIGVRCFRNCMNLTTINLTEWITSIQNEAFFACTGLTKLTLPKGVASIGTLVFAKCISLVNVSVDSANSVFYSLDGNLYYDKGSQKHIYYYCSGKKETSFTIPSGITHIDRFAFYFANYLETVTIPKSVLEVYDRSFYYCERISSFVVESGNQYYWVNNGDLYDTRTYVWYQNNTSSTVTATYSGYKRLVQYAIGKEDKYFDFPVEIKLIGSYCFAGSRYLETIDFCKRGYKFEYIGGYLTAGVESLRSVYLPTIGSSEIDNVNNSSFRYSISTNTSLDPKPFSDGGYGGIGGWYTNFSGNMFYDNNERGYAHANDFTTFFYDASSGVTVYEALIATRKTASGSGNFTYFTSFGVSSIEQCIALNNSSATYYVIYTISNGVATLTKAVVEGSFVVPEIYKGVNVTAISSSAFADNTNLISVDLPETITSLGTSAFKGCENLESVYLPEAITSLGTKLFQSDTATYTNNSGSGLNSNILVYVASQSNYNTMSAQPYTYGVKNASQIIASYGKYGPVYDTLTGVLTGYELIFASKNYIGEFNVLSTYNNEKVIQIGNQAFENRTNITSVNLPSTITTIEEYAFHGMTGLQNVNIEDTALVTIGDYAFSGCTSLQSIEYPYTVREIGIYAFENASSLQSENIEDTLVSEISDGLYFGTTSLTSSNIGDNVTKIGEYAYSKSGITSIVVPENVSEIGFGAFKGCSNLVSITVPYSGRASNNTSDSFGYIFGADSWKTNSISIPSSLKNVTITAENYSVTLNDYAFYGAQNIETVTLGAKNIYGIGQYAFYNCQSLTSINIPTSVTSIGSNAFALCLSLPELTVPTSVTSMGSSMLRATKSLETLTIPYVGANADYTTASSSTLGYLFGEITFTNGYAATQQYASGLAITYYIPSSLTTVNVTGVTGTKSATEIPYGAFQNCSSIANITVPSTITKIYNYAFSKVNIYELFLHSNLFTYTYDELDNAYVVTPNANIKLFGAYSLQADETVGVNAKELVIPDTVQIIGEGAFSGWSSLRKVTLPFIGERYNSTLVDNAGTSDRTDYLITVANVDYSNNVKFQKMFSYIFGTQQYDGSYVANSLTSGVTKFYSYVPTSLKTINLIGTAVSGGNSKTVVPTGAFGGLAEVNAITVPTTITQVEDYAFYGTGLTTFVGTNLATETDNTIHFKSELTEIGEYSFASEVNSTKLYVDDSVTDIGEGAFAKWASLEWISLPFAGSTKLDKSTTHDQTFAVIFGTEKFTNCVATNVASTYIPGPLETVIIRGGYLYTNGFQTYSNISDLTIGDGVTIIGTGICKEMVDLQHVSLPSTMSKIVTSMFEGCTSLEEITLPSTVTAINYAAFKNASSLKTINVTGNGLKAIADYAFYGTALETGEKSFTVWNTVETIGEHAFENNVAGNTTLIIGESVITIGEAAFGGWTSLVDITVPFVGTMYSSSISYSIEQELLSPNEGSSIFARIFGTESMDGTYPANWEYVIDNTNRVTGTSYVPSTLRTVTVNDGVIDYSSFSNVSSITTVTIPEGTTTIGMYAFDGCDSLTTVNNATELAYIEDYSFRGTSAMTSFAFPANLSLIGTGAFKDSGLTSLDLSAPADLATIREAAFENTCTTVTELEIPGNVTTIGVGAFEGWTSLQQVSLSLQNLNFASIFGDSSYTGSVTVSAHDGKFYYLPGSLKTVIVNGGTAVQSYALYNCSTIESVTISSSTVKTIEAYAFSGTSLKDITVPSTVTTIEEGAFNNTITLESMVLPFSGRSASETNNTETSVLGYIFGWSQYYNSSYTNAYQYYVNDDNQMTAYVTTDGEPRYYAIPKTLKYITIENESVNLANATLAGLTLETLTLEGVNNVGNYALYSTIGSLVFNDSVNFATAGQFGKLTNLIINFDFALTDEEEVFDFMDDIITPSEVNKINYPTNYITINEVAAKYLTTTDVYDPLLSAYDDTKTKNSVSSSQNVYILSYDYDYVSLDKTQFTTSDIVPYLYDYRANTRTYVTVNAFTSPNEGSEVDHNNNVVYRIFLDLSSNAPFSTISRLSTTFMLNTSKMVLDLDRYAYTDDAGTFTIMVGQRIADGIAYSNYGGKFASSTEAANYVTVSLQNNQGATVSEDYVTSVKKTTTYEGFFINVESVRKYDSSEYYVLDEDYEVYQSSLEDGSVNITVNALKIKASMESYTVEYDGAKHSVEIVFADNFDTSGITYAYTVKIGSRTVKSSSLPSYVNANTYNYTITLKKDGYDDLVLEASVTITKKNVNVAIDANQGVEYGQNDPEITYVATYDDGSEVANSILTGRITRVAGDDVGPYAYVTSTLSLVNKTNYSLTFTNATDEDIYFKVAEAGLSATTISYKNLAEGHDIPTFTYTGSKNEVYGYLVVEFYNTKQDTTETLTYGIDYTLTYTNNIDVGEYEVLITAMPSSRFFGYNHANYKIEARDISTADITLASDTVEYNGKEVISEVTKVEVSYYDNTTASTIKLVVPTNSYTTTYEDNIEMGNATVTVTATGNFTGSASDLFRITPRTISLTDEDFTFAKIADQKFTSVQITPSIEIYFHDELLEEGVDYTLGYDENIDVGYGYVKVTGMGNFTTEATGVVNVSFKIVPATSSIIKFEVNTEVAYTGLPTNLIIKTFTIAGNDVKDDVNEHVLLNTDYKISYKTADRTNLGIVRYTITGYRNLAGWSSSGIYRVSAISISYATVDVIGTYTFTGSPIEPTINVTYGTETLTKNVDYYVEYGNNINASSEAIVRVYGMGDYEGTGTEYLEKNFTIGQQTITSSQISYTDTSKYTGSAPELNVVITNAAGNTLVYDQDYTLVYNDTAVGTGYEAIIACKGNYSGSLAITYSITQYGLSSLDSVTAKTQAYTGEYITPDVVVVDINGNKLTSGTDFIVAYQFGSDGRSQETQYITITGIGNYTGELEATFDIVGSSDVPEETWVTLESDSVTYTGRTVSPEVIVKNSNDEVLNEGTDYTLSYENAVDVGEATVTVLFITYAGEVSKNYNITQYEITEESVGIQFTDSYVYNGETPLFDLTLTQGNFTLVEGTDYTLTYSGSTVGDHTLTIAGIGNYTGSIEKVYHITKLGGDEEQASEGGVKLKVVAESSTFIYSGVTPTLNLTVTYNNLTFTDYQILYYTDKLFTNQVETAANVGTYYYKVVVSTDNVAGVGSESFVISERDIGLLSATVEDVERIYNGSVWTPKVTFEDTYGTVTFTSSYTNNINAGTASILLTGNGNFTGTKKVEFTITSVSVSTATITLDKESSVYDSLNTYNLPVITVDGYELSYPFTSNAYSVTIRNLNTGKLVPLGSFSGEVAKYKIIVTGVVPNATGSQELDYEITKCQITVDNVSQDYTGNYFYTGTVQSFEDLKILVTSPFTGEVVTLAIDQDYTLTYNDATTVGENRTVTITGINSYYGSFDKTYNISVVDDPNAEIEIEMVYEEYTYTASSITPQFNILYNGFRLSDGYEITYYSDAAHTIELDGAPSAIGTYYFRVVTDGTSIGSSTAYSQFDIVGISLADSSVKVTLNPTEYVYNGETPSFGTLVVKDANGNTLVQGTDYVVHAEDWLDYMDDDTYVDKFEIGNGQMLVIAGIGNYKDYAYTLFDIIALDLSNSTASAHVDILNNSIEYNPSEPTNEFPIVTIDGKEYPYNPETGKYDSSVFAVTLFDANNNELSFAEVMANSDGGLVPGTYSITITVISSDANVSAGTSKSIAFNVIERTILETDVTDAYTGTYEFTNDTPDFADISLVITGTNNTTLVRDTDFTVSTTEEVTLGENKTVTITGIGKYTGSFTLTYKIIMVAADNVDQNALILTETDKTYTYNGQGQDPAFTVTYKGFTLTDDYSIKYYSDSEHTQLVGETAQKDAGTYYYEVTIGGTTIEQGIVYGTYTINKAAITIFAQNAESQYGETIVDMAGQGLYMIDGTTYDEIVPVLTTDATSTSPVGDEYIINVSLTDEIAKNYELTDIPAKYTITQREVHVTITIGDATKSWDSKAFDPTTLELTITIDDNGYVGEDDQSVWTLVDAASLGNIVFLFDGSATAPSAEGTYVITLQNVKMTATNYKVITDGITYNSGSLEITEPQVIQIVEGSTYTFALLNEEYDEDEEEYYYYRRNYSEINYVHGVNDLQLAHVTVANVLAETSVNSFLENFLGDKNLYRLTNNDGDIIWDCGQIGEVVEDIEELDDYEVWSIGTGWKLEFVANETVIDTIYVSVLGDLNGDGFWMANDYRLLKNVITGKNEFDASSEAEYLLACYVRNDGFYSARDYRVLKNVIQGTNDMADYNI